MRHVPKLGLLTMTVLSLAQTVCAAQVSYRLTTNGDKHRCEIFFEALKASRLAYMSDQQFCDVMNSPISNTLHGKYIRDIDWNPVSVKSKKELVSIARNIQVSDMMGRPLSSKSEEQFRDDFYGPHGVIYQGGVVVERSKVRIGTGKYYLLQLRRKVCDANYKGFTGLPMWGVLEKKNILSGMVNDLPTVLPAGNLFFIKDRLYAFQSFGWRKGFDYDLRKNYQTVDVLSVDEVATSGSKKSLAIGSECVVVIHNPLRH